MTYVPSRTYSEDAATRAAVSYHGAKPSRRDFEIFLEKQARLITSAVSAGWEEAEVRAALSGEDVAEAIDNQSAQQTPARDVVPSSSM
ncbi:hypothetical protein [Rhizobium leguminosarum]|uniref:hypothetical protein n=1 Tax=Rhizobium leguminosarum TaxID=384 RepID=UPI0015FE102C|nr:hypothetical protein [Rhizobium leguminosarum]MBA9031744.1 hypothetical protein [Rhizobium leguminosarum]